MRESLDDSYKEEAASVACSVCSTVGKNCLNLLVASTKLLYSTARYGTNQLSLLVERALGVKLPQLKEIPGLTLYQLQKAATASFMGTQSSSGLDWKSMCERCPDLIGSPSGLPDEAGFEFADEPPTPRKQDSSKAAEKRKHKFSDD